MNIELLVVDADTGEMYDVSEIAKEVNWTTQLEGTAGTLTFSLTKSALNFPAGSDVIFRIPNKADIFKGKVFTTSFNRDRELEVTAYDQLRYLKNNETYIFKNMAAHQIFEKICKDLGLSYEIRARVDHICVPAIRDNRPLNEMIQLALDETYIFEQEYLFVRDDFGKVVLDNINNYQRNYILDKEVIAEDFSYNRSIDSGTYNQVKLLRLDKNNNVELMYFQEDPATVKKWGPLRLFQKADENATSAELKQRAGYLLGVRNSPVEKLSFTCEGKLDLFAGCGLYINLNEIITGKTAKYCIILAAQHTFTNNEHKMTLEVRI